MSLSSPAPEGPEVAVPDGVEPIIAWRYWRFDPKTGHLKSLARDRTEWQPNVVFSARCRYERLDHTDARWRLVDGSLWKPHTSPSEDCRCGIYGARNLRSLRSQFLFGLNFNVVGEVSLWGKLIRGVKGYRAQFAYPRSLFVVHRIESRRRRAIEALADYGVPVESLRYDQVGFSPSIALVDALKRAATKVAG